MGTNLSIGGAETNYLNAHIILMLYVKLKAIMESLVGGHFALREMCPWWSASNTT